MYIIIYVSCRKYDRNSTCIAPIRKAKPPKSQLATKILYEPTTELAFKILFPCFFFLTWCTSRALMSISGLISSIFTFSILPRNTAWCSGVSPLRSATFISRGSLTFWIIVWRISRFSSSRATARCRGDRFALLLADIYIDRYTHTHFEFSFLQSRDCRRHGLRRGAGDTCVSSCCGVATIRRLLEIIGLFAKEPYKRDDILQKRPMILRSLLIVATPWQIYVHTHTHTFWILISGISRLLTARATARCRRDMFVLLL